MNRRTTAIAMLALVAGFSTGCVDRTSSARLEQPASASAPAAATSAPAEEPTRVVTLVFAGDVHFQLNLAALLDHQRGALGPITRTLRDPTSPWSTSRVR